MLSETPPIVSSSDSPETAAPSATTDNAGTASTPVSAPPTSAASAPIAPALPEAAAQEPPRSLVPGAFLRSEFEVKAVIARGMTNIYAAQGGDYGAPALKLIAERN